jgi:hypothetical protein
MDLPSALRDGGVDELSRASGSAGSISRGRWLAAATLGVGVLGALGVALRPVLRRAFAGNAAAQAARASDARAERAHAGRADGSVQAKIARLAELQRAHRSRHPMLHGIVAAGVPPDSSVERAG